MAVVAEQYRKKENVRYRPIQEWSGLLAYTPDQPNVLCLNGTSWIILELVGDDTVGEARNRFAELMADVEPEARAFEIFDTGLEMLAARGLIEPVLEEVAS